MREPGNNYSENQYDRPSQPWVCGHSVTGQACPAGPSARGHCPAMSECAPLRNGDRWECNRSQLRGGPCDAGPTPEGGCGRVLSCHPLRSLRTVRGRFVKACAVLTAGVAIICLSADWRDLAIAPGPLARQHAQLMEQTGSAAICAACHAAANQNLAGWVTSLAIHRGDQPNQSQLCMSCHSQTISSELALAAHNVPAEALQELSAMDVRFAKNDGANRGNSTSEQLFKTDGNIDRRAGPIACSACHREHHGAEFNLATIDNAACQSCHRQRFESFAADHPDLGIWPYERRTRITFNHATHRDKHFAEKKQAFNCATCHTADNTGRVQLTASYEATCATCHDEKISTSVARGVPMFALPTLDVAALRSTGADIAEWPKRATGDFDGRFPPVMKLLLAGDPVADQALAKLGVDFDFQDVDPKDRQQLDACAVLASATIKLCNDLATSPDEAIRTRLHSVLGREISDQQARMLLGGLSTDTVRAAIENWFAENKTAAAAAKLRPVASHGDILPKRNHPRTIVFDLAGDWQRDDGSFSIRYRPTAHADPVLATWLTVLAETPKLEQHPIVAAMFKELSKPTAQGLCASCHSVERAADNQLAINWRANDRTNERRGFTKFSHGPHLVIPQLADCSHCHAIESQAAATTTYTGHDPTHFVSDFAPIAKRQCSSCHTSTAAGNACQSCHNYHVEGTFLVPQENTASTPRARAGRLAPSPGTR